MGENKVEVPRHWRLIKERGRGPGYLDQEGQRVVNGKIFDPITGQTRSPVEMALQRPNESWNHGATVVIAAMAGLVSE